MRELESVVPVILSGGSGTRLWPMSTTDRPKQFLALTAAETMLQLTVQRIGGAEGCAPAIIVANAAHGDFVEQQLATIGCHPQHVILEPAARNTAPAIALAAIAAGGSDQPLLVMPSDHVIADVDAFRAAIAAAMPIVADGWLATFGITPDHPATGFGWIKIGETLGAGVNRAERFVEKPPLDKAEAMLASGDHAWNGGIFMFRADAYLDALGRFAPDILAAAQAAMDKADRQGRRLLPDGEAFAASPSNSIDYAVMERAERVAVVPVAMGWSDVGSWDALYDVSARDALGNSATGDVVLQDTSNCLVRSDGNVTVALHGVSDLIVVASGSTVMILPRGSSQEVKALSALAGERRAG
jgi:mannose-1-phosphate guanylyltransferase